MRIRRFLIGIVLDTSGSMGGNLAVSRKAVVEFFKSANPEDEAFLVEFSDRPSLVLPFTHNLRADRGRDTDCEIERQYGAARWRDARGSEMKKATHPRKALILLSDGGDNHSRYTETEVRNRVRESDVQIYAMGIFSRRRRC